MGDSIQQLPLVTFCIPVYQSADTLARSLDSIFAQDYPQVQIIIADDASTDNTATIAHDYQNHRPDSITVMQQPHNVGVTQNALSIYPHIKGDYVIWFAGDDECCPGRLHAQVSYLEQHPDCVACYHDVWIQSQGGNAYRYHDPHLGQRFYSGDIAGQLMTHRCFIPGISMMLRWSRTHEIRHNPDIPHCSDWLYFIEIAMLGPIHYLPQPLAIYHRHSNNQTHHTQTDHHPESQVYAYLQQRYGTNYEAAINQGLVNLYGHYAFKYMFLKQWQQAWRMAQCLWALLRQQPQLCMPALKSLVRSSFQRIALWQHTRSVFH